MAINKKKEEKEIKYTPEEIEVSKVKAIRGKKDCYRFNMRINGVDIYACQYVTYVSKDGEEKCFIAFPQYKGTDDKYYNNCYFPINHPSYKKEFEFVEKEIEKAINT